LQEGNVVIKKTILVISDKLVTDLSVAWFPGKSRQETAGKYLVILNDASPFGL
jgi:hypothetical protein